MVIDEKFKSAIPRKICIEIYYMLVIASSHRFCLPPGSLTWLPLDVHYAGWHLLLFDKALEFGRNGLLETLDHILKGLSEPVLSDSLFLLKGNPLAKLSNISKIEGYRFPHTCIIPPSILLPLQIGSQAEISKIGFILKTSTGLPAVLATS